MLTGQNCSNRLISKDMTSLAWEADVVSGTRNDIPPVAWALVQLGSCWPCVPLSAPLCMACHAGHCQGSKLLPLDWAVYFSPLATGIIVPGTLKVRL